MAIEDFLTQGLSSFGPNIVYIQYVLYAVYVFGILYLVLYLYKYRHRAVIVEQNQGTLKVTIRRCREIRDTDGAITEYQLMGRKGSFLPPKELERLYVWGGFMQATVFMLHRYGENQFAHVSYNEKDTNYYPLESDVRHHLVNRMAKAQEDNKLKTFWREYGDSVIMITGIVGLMFGMYLLFNKSLEAQGLANEMLSRVPEITKAAIEACKETLALA